ncbi:uncharacterized protein LOC134695384 isoform X2 [Mytilus trossulus]|uniref:uncharacterized protein LOC134695384 isoform X2 n=1 Tax=Mytilus trossulus TaxID=6551 RepID=UPI003006EB31
MMFLYILGISSLYIKAIHSCSVHVCLTWEATKENITFKCKVTQLRFKVDFFNPKNEEQGYCTSPLPEPRCYSSHNIITQDRRTNTTVLVIERHVDNKLNGPWKCNHGTNIEAAIVNLTVLQQETFKIIFKNDICGEQHMAWTLFGALIGLVIVLILWIVSKTRQWYLATRFIICILLMCLTISIAYASGLLENKCKDKELFIIFGVCMVLMSVICLSFPQTVSKEKEYWNKRTKKEQDQAKAKLEEALIKK